MTTGYKSHFYENRQDMTSKTSESIASFRKLSHYIAMARAVLLRLARSPSKRSDINHKDTSMSNSLVGMAELEGILGLSRCTIYSLVEMGLPHLIVPTSGQYRFNPSAVFAWLEKQSNEDHDKGSDAESDSDGSEDEDNIEDEDEEEDAEQDDDEAEDEEEDEGFEYA